MKPKIYFLFFFCSLTLISCSKKNATIVELDSWTDSVLKSQFYITHKFDSTVTNGADRFREWSYSKNLEQYILVDGKDTLVNILTFKEPDLKIIKEYCVENKNSKYYERIIYDGMTNGRVTEINCDENIIKTEYYLNDSLIELKIK